jgi:hypothetical protein
MNPLIFALILIFSSATTTTTTTAFKITRLLGKYPELSTFNEYLTKTNLQHHINHRPTITILALDNKAISSLSGLPLDVINQILSLHVLLDYYDIKNLSMLSTTTNTALLTTLYSQTGGAGAVNQRGFLKVGMVGEGEIAFGSAEKGSSLDVKLVKSVVSHPRNISVLQVTAPINIIAPGIDASSAPKPSAKAPINIIAPGIDESSAAKPLAKAPAPSPW